MTGIVFFATEQLETVLEFYTDRVGAEIQLTQPGCTILRYENLLVGFCDRDTTDTDGIVTFVYDDTESVDEKYRDLDDIATDQPHENTEYRIYQFFATDPDGRTIEFQTFLHETDF